MNKSQKNGIGDRVEIRLDKEVLQHFFDQVFKCYKGVVKRWIIKFFLG